MDSVALVENSGALDVSAVNFSVAEVTNGYGGKGATGREVIGRGSIKDNSDGLASEERSERVEAEVGGACSSVDGHATGGD